MEYKQYEPSDKAQGTCSTAFSQVTAPAEAMGQGVWGNVIFLLQQNATQAVVHTQLACNCNSKEYLSTAKQQLLHTIMFGHLCVIWLFVSYFYRPWQGFCMQAQNNIGYMALKHKKYCTTNIPLCRKKMTDCHGRHNIAD